jgi:peptide/nickel transport system ATP-binding protein
VNDWTSSRLDGQAGRAGKHKGAGMTTSTPSPSSEPSGAAGAPASGPAGAGHNAPEVANLLSVEDLTTYFFTRNGVVRAVDGVSFALKPKETLAIVGESGCGKSITALSLLRLVPDPPGRIVKGRIVLDGTDLVGLQEEAMRKVRGNDISMIFQEPMTSLNPVMTIGRQIAEVLLLHQGLDKQAAHERAIEMLRLVKIPEPEQRVREYPHQLSGGMRQRAMIAIALACNPKVLIADEPTTALDVTIQAQILDLMSELRERLGTAIILITHDLGVVAETAERVIVMYAGRKVEEAPVGELFARPLHPYTHGLLASIPRLDLVRGQAKEGEEPERLQEIPGIVPALYALPSGCAFAPRCQHADEKCRSSYPPYEEKRPGHWAACWHSEALYGGRHG